MTVSLLRGAFALILVISVAFGGGAAAVAEAPPAGANPAGAAIIPPRKPEVPAAQAAPKPPAVLLPDGVLPGPGRPFAYFAETERLADVLAAFGRSMMLPIRVGAGVDGLFSGRLAAPTAEDFLDLLARNYGLVWFFDGAVLYVDSTNAIGSRTVQLEGATPGELRKALTSLGIPVDRFGWRQLNSGRMVIVTGPPRLLELVEQSASAIDHPPEPPKPPVPVIRVFPLTHALADDRTLTARNQKTVVPGVASILRNLLAGQSASVVFDNGRQQQISTSMERLRGTGLAGDRPTAASPPAPGPAQPMPMPMPPAAGQLPPAVIQSDSRLNAVIIRDVPERMEAYADVIRIIDVPVKLVEIEVSIIDISSSALDTLGVDWRLQGRRFSAGYGDVSGVGTAMGETFSTILSSGATSFIARVQALQQNGSAHILSRPSVLTIDNVEALLDHSETFYVRVAGRDEVDLFPVSVGIMLRVTPHVMEAGALRNIQLLVDIEDGSVLDRQVDEIPNVQRSTISTQAIVAEHQSLLIGGVSRQANSMSDAGIPGLHKIPVVGSLFGTNNQETQDTKRLFLITPKVISQ